MMAKRRSVTEEDTAEVFAKKALRVRVVKKKKLKSPQRVRSMIHGNKLNQVVTAAKTGQAQEEDRNDRNSKPMIEILSKYMNVSEVLNDAPYAIFKKLTSQELQQLRGDLKSRLEIDRATPNHTEFWEALLVCCDNLDQQLIDAQLENEAAVAVAVAVNDNLQRMTRRELAGLESQIDSKIRFGRPDEVDFWEAVSKRLPFFKAKAVLDEFHAHMLRNFGNRAD